jgi:hypothetical protein
MRIAFLAKGFGMAVEVMWPSRRTIVQLVAREKMITFPAELDFWLFSAVGAQS